MHEVEPARRRRSLIAAVLAVVALAAAALGLWTPQQTSAAFTDTAQTDGTVTVGVFGHGRYVSTYDLDAPGCTTTAITLPLYSTNVSVDWGDGTVKGYRADAPTHDYGPGASGKRTVTVRGLFDRLGSSSAPVTASNRCLVSVDEWQGTGTTSAAHGWRGAQNLTSVVQPPATVTDWSFLFYGASSFNQPIGHWATSQVTAMESTFEGASSFNQPIGSWDVSNVTNMSGMFAGAYSFNQPLGGWDVSNVTDMSWMFWWAMAYDRDMSGWDVRNVVETTGFVDEVNTALRAPNWPKFP